MSGQLFSLTSLSPNNEKAVASTRVPVSSRSARIQGDGSLVVVGADMRDLTGATDAKRGYTVNTDRLSLRKVRGGRHAANAGPQAFAQMAVFIRPEEVFRQTYPYEVVRLTDKKRVTPENVHEEAVRTCLDAYDSAKRLADQYMARAESLSSSGDSETFTAGDVASMRSSYEELLRRVMEQIGNYKNVSQAGLPSGMSAQALGGSTPNDQRIAVTHTDHLGKKASAHYKPSFVTYDSVDGNTYSVLRGHEIVDATGKRVIVPLAPNPEKGVPSVFETVLLHAAAEMAKGGQFCTPINALQMPLRDGQGTPVHDFRPEPKPVIPEVAPAVTMGVDDEG